MNKKWIPVLLMVLFLFVSLGYTQDKNLSDQNPRHYKSAEKYLIISDSLLRTQGTTVQQTYKAYDWYTARQERRALRKERRHLERVSNPYWDWYYPSFGFYNNIGFNNWGWYPSYGFRIGGFW
ncbi:hypothetical protein H8S90_19310 [Olivibacter sp. SDN3]|uniref:hypothetical protein n=1 Tax=Olivibacter sp. SDN3 TaxID=2764720 RepID=UPI00165130F4|nr:hypothetical protein [Olivibacter sp. SDN3]QNL48884.1 hypothetical protein H8S90_19310 [Olivibacter sp. SDN3]